jgi:hypothetical protein
MGWATKGRSVDVEWTTLTLDCRDGEELAGFWSRLLGWDVVARDGAGWFQLRGPSGVGQPAPTGMCSTR